MLMVLRWLIAGELGLGLLAWIWALRSDTEIPWELGRGPILTALGITVAFTAVNFVVFKLGRRFAFADDSREMFEQDLFPLIRQASAFEILAVSALAGFAEELLFRGMILPRMGLVASSVLFGFLHGPDYRLWPMALWATIVGLGLALLYRETGNLAIPMIVHGVYDALALAYIRLTPSTKAGSGA